MVEWNPYPWISLSLLPTLHSKYKSTIVLLERFIFYMFNFWLCWWIVLICLGLVLPLTIISELFKQFPHSFLGHSLSTHCVPFSCSKISWGFSMLLHMKFPSSGRMNRISWHARTTLREYVFNSALLIYLP